MHIDGPFIALLILAGVAFWANRAKKNKPPSGQPRTIARYDDHQISGSCAEMDIKTGEVTPLGPIYQRTIKVIYPDGRAELSFEWTQEK